MRRPNPSTSGNAGALQPQRRFGSLPTPTRHSAIFGLMRFWWRPAKFRTTSRPRSKPIKKSGAQPLEELVDLRANPAGDAAKIVGDRFYRGGTRARILRRGAYKIDFRGGLRSALGGNVDTARDFLRGRALLGDGGGDRAADVSDFANRLLDTGNCRDRALRRTLHSGDLRTDFLGGPAGLPGQCLHFAGHHRKPASGLAGARRLDGRVEREQICLLGNVGDELDHVADAGGGLVQLLDRKIGGFDLVDRFGRNRVGL